MPPKTCCDEIFYFVCRFGVHYELPLLIQSLIMTVTMLVMMHICVTVKKESTPTTIHRSIWGKAVDQYGV